MEILLKDSKVEDGAGRCGVETKVDAPEANRRFLGSQRSLGMTIFT